MDTPAICAALGITKPTVVSYINALEALFLFEKVSPWIKTDYDRVGKRAKTYAADTGFMTAVLGWKEEDVFMDKDRSGKLMETFVFQELAAHVDLDKRYALYQYRDRLQREIDFLIEREDGEMIGIEVKAGHNVSKDDFAAQEWFVENILQNKKPYRGYVLYSGQSVLPFGKNMMAVPIASLWTE